MKRKQVYAIILVVVVFSDMAAQLKNLATDTISPSQKYKSSRTPEKKTKAGYMGLFDWNLSAGYLTSKDDKTNPDLSIENRQMNGIYLMGHFQESLLSNYFWKTDQDTKVKFGFQETLDLGASRQFMTTTYGPPEIKTQTSGFGFIFSYEAALAIVYKINDDWDAGISYYALSLSTFNMDHQRYAKLRLRYRHFMCEVSSFGKTAVDLKYLMGTKDNFGKHDRSMNTYFGFSFTGRNETFPLYNRIKNQNYFHISYGICF